MKRSSPDLRRIEAAVGSAAAVYQTPTLSALEDVAAELVAADPQVVAIWGGDGTCGATLSALGRAFGTRPLPRICVLPAGTMNVISRCLGARGTPASVLTRLRRAVTGGAPLQELHRRPIRIGDQLGFLFGVGLIPNLLEVYDDAARAGAWRALQVFGMASRNLARPGYDRFFAPFEARLTVGDRLWTQGRLTNISAGAIECLPFGLRPYVRANEHDGAFHLVAHALDARGALAEIARIRAGKGMKRVDQDIFSSIRIEVDMPMPYNIDGDNFEPRQVFELSSGPPLIALVP